MDPLTLEKLYALKRYKRTHFLQLLMKYSLTAFVLGICVSMVFPSLFSSTNVLFGTLPNMGAFVVSPKCLFVVCNVIVIYLVGESKLVGTARAAAVAASAPDIYDEYVNKRRVLRRHSTFDQEKDRKKKLVLEVGGEYSLHGEDQEEFGLSAEELNKRAEDFIARVNKQRMREANISA